MPKLFEFELCKFELFNKSEYYVAFNLVLNLIFLKLE